MKNISITQKIFWLHPHFLNWTGGLKYIYEIASRLNKDYEVIMVSDIFPAEAKEKFRKQKIKIQELSGISTNSPFYWIFLPFFILKDYIILGKLVKKGDILISSMFPMNVIAMLIGEKHIQICYEPFAFFYDVNFVNGFPGFRKFFIRTAKHFYAWLDVMATRKANVVLTLSDFNKRWIKNIYGKDSVVVYEGVDTKFFIRKVNRKLSNKYSYWRVIFHSTDFTKIKGTEFLFRAMPIVKKNVPNVKLLISTTLTNKRVKQTLLNYAKINGFADNIEFLGFLDYKLMPIYLSLADVVVQPSIGQSMNLTIKESMSCGTPVVTSLEGSEQFKDSTAGYLVDPEKTSELGDKIVRLLKNKDLGEKMGVKGRNIIRSKFSWGAVYRKIDGVIKETANQ